MLKGGKNRREKYCISNGSHAYATGQVLSVGQLLKMFLTVKLLN